MYKLLVLDLDGTLTNSQKKITGKTKEAIRKAQEKGIKVVLASGRPTYGIVPLANELRLDTLGGYILSYNGGEIIDWKTKEVLHARQLDPQVLPYLYKSAKKNDFAIITYQNQFIITESPDDIYVHKEAFLNKMEIKKVDNFLSYVDYPVSKCLITGESEQLIVLEKEMNDYLKGTMGVFRSEPFFLELVPNGIDKAQSLGILLEKLGMTADEMMACGDGFNDLSMIQFAGLGVAMGNAQLIVRQQADFITLSNEEDGVAHVVERFLL